MFRLKVDVELRLADKRDKVIAYGTCTIDRFIKFIVQIRVVTIDNQEEWKIYFPKQKKDDLWQELIEFKDRHLIEGEVTKALHALLLEDTRVFSIKEIRVTDLIPPKPNGSEKILILCNARVELEHITINGIQLKQYKGNFILQMPQYISNGKYKDIVFPIDAKIREYLKQKVLEKYLEELESCWDANIIQEELSYLKQEINVPTFGT